MTFRQGLLAARGNIVFLLALIVAFALIFTLEAWEPSPRQPPNSWLPEEEAAYEPPPFHELTPDQLGAARSAWGYFEANIRPETGLADSVAGYPATTLWDTGSFLLGAVSAERLGVLNRPSFDTIVEEALESLLQMPLFAGLLPNKSYDTRTLQMTNYANEPVDQGIGWSALDLGRMLVSLHTIMRHYPEHAPAVSAVLDYWDIGAAVRQGEMVGAEPTAEGGYLLLQEGRVGYEQYAAMGFAVMGYDVQEAQRVERHLDWFDVFGVEVPEDRRDPETFGGHTYTLSDPYILHGLEFGWDTRTAALARRVYEAQERRHAETGIITAVTEDHLDRPPYFVYSTVVGNGKPWNVLTDTGEQATDYRTLSTKGSMGWHVLYGSDYTASLFSAVADLQTPEGWMAGHFETFGEPNTVLTANTNGVILSALHYSVFGPILHPRMPEDEGRSGLLAAEEGK
ncbi:DUF3131 domain-containing protein (plasmid) [Paracoccus liaowanqingii]|uniref:DUF3131 domain-containing protein n=1 Tax=Paracoccus liaowanqingii TaxID=2560053 RepID=A0A4Y5SR00_9RHOB|nr:DUF3131 domain-containing protein [Paracoccus liaowanqingii]QDA35917.1 DUF3131 domain-containing protein [Paracoccus liaowanqingii]